LLLVSISVEQMLAIFALSSVISASWFGEFLTKYRILRQKIYLLVATFCALLGIGSIVLFVRYLGILQGWW